MTARDEGEASPHTGGFWAVIRKCTLGLLGILLTVMAVPDSPMLLIFPMWIFTYLGRDPIRKAIRGLPLWASFIGAGVFFGLLTEVFAIAENWSLPPEQRILLSPDPFLDIFYGGFYYSLLIATWYLLVRRFTYSKTEIFLITGLLGIFTEETGQVFLRIFSVPVVGALYAIIVSLVYGIFPMLAYMVSEEKIDAEPRAGVCGRFLVAALALFVQWAFYGLVILPALKALGS